MRQFILIVVGLSIASYAPPAESHEPHVCPPGINDAPALSAHVHQKTY